jgi:RNA polymerase sigma-70 factor (ECF subfamily)
MAPRAIWNTGRPEEAGQPRITHLDRDRALVAAARADPARFEALYRKYLAQVYSYAYYELGDHHDAEDATERTFVAALTNLQRFEERARPEDADRQRARYRRPEEQLDAAAAIADGAADPAAQVVRRDEAGAAWRAIERLPGDRRRAIILRFVDEMSTSEIAGVLGRSEGAVRVLIHRALRSVARDLDEEGR